MDDAPPMFDVWEGFNSLGGHWVDGREDGVYKPDLQTDQLIEFLEAQADADKPFNSAKGWTSLFHPAHPLAVHQE